MFSFLLSSLLSVSILSPLSFWKKMTFVIIFFCFNHGWGWEGVSSFRKLHFRLANTSSRDLNLNQQIKRKKKKIREGKRLRNSLPYLLHSLATNELCTSFVLISTHTHTHTHSHTYSHTHSLTHTFTHTFTHTSVKIGKSRKRILKFRQWPSRVGVASFLTLKRQWIQHLAFCKDEMRCASECFNLIPVPYSTIQFFNKQTNKQTNKQNMKG